MVTSINTSGISVGNDGKVNVSGLTSSIDWKGIVEAQIKASRIPAIKLEAKMAANTAKIASYGELKVKTQAVTDALDKLRGTTGLSSTNVFKVKTASGTTTAKDGAPVNHVPSDITSLVTASISQSAAAGNHTITVQQVAKAHQIRGDQQASTTAQLNQTGSFTVNGKTVTLAATDTLLDLRSKINASGAGVNASIVSASGTEHYLVLTSTTTGEDAEIDFGAGNAITDALGFTDGTGVPGGDIKNELQEAKNAIIDVDGITGIERQTNEVDDVIEGVTLQLLKAETNTDINLKIEPDLNSVKAAIVDLVEAYNDLRAFAKDQRTAKDRNNDGTIGKAEFGDLAFDNTMRNIMAQLGNFAVTDMDDNADGFQSLGQIGVAIDKDYNLKIDDTILDNRLITNVGEIQKLFALNTASSDSRLTILSRAAGTASGTYYVNIGGTDSQGNVLSANIKNAAGEDVAGLDDGSITVSNNILEVLTGPAAGLKIYFGGGNNLGPIPDIQVDVQRGIADQFYDFFGDTTRETVGSLATLATQADTENTEYQKRIDTIDARLEIQKATLEARFIAMESALAQMEQLKKTLSSYFDAGNSDN